MLGNPTSSIRRRVAAVAVALVAAAVVPLTAGPAWAAPFTVTNCHDSGTGSLPQTVSDANSTVGADTITFTTTCPGAGIVLTGEIAISDDLTITGPGVADLVISGNGATRVFNIAAGTAVTISRVTITNGAATEGGGILNAGTLTLTNSTLSSNSATCLATFVSCSAAGGGINNVSGGTVAVTGSTFSGNTASCSAGLAQCSVAGGGINNASTGTVAVTNSTLSSNTASCETSQDVCSAAGGGINNASTGTVAVTNSTLSSNTASCDTGQDVCSAAGGGINNASTGTVAVTNSTLSSNTASCVNGVVRSCSAAGGGISNGSTGTVAVTNSTLSSNTASCVSHGFSPCSAVGGGISKASTGAVTLAQTIVASSVGGNCDGTISDGGSNLSFPDACGAVVAGPDPTLGALADNGGPTLTHALLPGSPAIDAAGTCGLATDQRGVLRPQGPACDIGAFEVAVGGGGGGGDDGDGGGHGGVSGRRGRITIVEDVRPDRDVTFGFHTKVLKVPTFRLADGHKRDFTNLKAGTYTVAQDTKDGWTLDTIVCQDPTHNTKVNLDTRRAVIKLRAGEHVTCTFTDKKK